MPNQRDPKKKFLGGYFEGELADTVEKIRRARGFETTRETLEVLIREAAEMEAEAAREESLTS